MFDVPKIRQHICIFAPQAAKKRSKRHLDWKNMIMPRNCPNPQVCTPLVFELKSAKGGYKPEGFHWCIQKVPTISNVFSGEDNKSWSWRATRLARCWTVQPAASHACGSFTENRYGLMLLDPRKRREEYQYLKEENAKHGTRNLRMPNSAEGNGKQRREIPIQLEYS